MARMVCPITEKKSQASMSISVQPIQTALNSTSYFLKTLYLFTAADFATFAIPTTLFGLFGALSGPVLSNGPASSLLQILSRIPATLILIWINLLIFNISNQRSPSAVEEDRINKPHRPIPSGRITSEAARDLCLIFVPIVLAAGWLARVEHETLLLFTFQWMYNDLAGCDAHFFVRNAFIAIGYGLYSAIALRVMIGASATLNATGLQWIGAVVLVMMFTQHICDIKDAEGDRLRGRKSAPIVLGDEACRWTVAVPVMICSAACPMFFGLGIKSYIFTMSFGGLVAFRTMAFRTVKADKLTWKLWALYTVSLFSLPLISNADTLYLAWQSLSNVFCSSETCFDGLDVAAASCVALAFEGKRIVTYAASKQNQTIPIIKIEGVVA